MPVRGFGHKLKSVIDESDAIFGSLRQIHQSIYQATNHIYDIHAEDPVKEIEKMKVVTEHLEFLLGRLDQDSQVISHLRGAFETDEDAPSPLNQAFAIGYARMANRLFHRSHKNALRLYTHVSNYFAVRNLNSLERIRLFAKIYGRFLDTEVDLSRGMFALRIAYNHALSKKIVSELLANTLTVRDLRVGDVILSYKTSPYLEHHLLSRLISIAENKNITHSALVYSTKGSHISVFAASGDQGHVGIYDLKPLKGEFWFVFRPQVPAHERRRLNEAIQRWAEEVERNPTLHRFAELKSWIAVFIGYLTAEFVLHSYVIAMIPNLAHSDRDYFCSDIIDKIYKEVGIHLVPRSRNDGVIGPAELFYSPYLQHVGVYVNQDDLPSLKKEKWVV